MKYLHWEVQAGPQNMIRVDLGSAANIVLLDDHNYTEFQRGASCRYQGGYYRQSPVCFAPLRSCRWHVVVHLGGYAGRVSAAVKVA